MVRAIAWSAFALSFASAAFADDSPIGLSTYEAQGKIGSYSIGLDVTVRNKTQFVAGHYFYASHGTDIPLSGHSGVEGLTLQEPGGGVFLLHLVSNDSAKGQALNFYNSTGLQGTWTQGAKTLPVTLTFETTYDEPVSGTRYSDVTSESDVAFEARVRRFLQAAIHGDRPVAAETVSYPLTVNMARALTIRSKADLLAQWDVIFTPRLVAELRDAIPHEMFVHEGMAMIDNGLVWFDARGAKTINEPE